MGIIYAEATVKRLPDTNGQQVAAFTAGGYLRFISRITNPKASKTQTNTASSLIGIPPLRWDVFEQPPKSASAYQA